MWEIIKQFFYRSYIMILFFVCFTSILLVSAAMVLQEFISVDSNKLYEDTAVQLTVIQHPDISFFSNADFIEYLNSNTKPVLLSKHNDIAGGSELLLHSGYKIKNRMFEPVFGTSENIFADAEPVALANETIKKQAYQNGNDFYLYHNNIPLKIQKTYTGQSFPLYYVPMLAVMKSRPQNDFSGTYIIDAGTFTNDFIDELVDKIYAKSQITDIEIIPTYTQKPTIFDFLLKEQGKMVFLMLVSGLSLFLNMYSIIKYWVDGKKTEIRVLQMVGATHNQLKKRILINYLAIISIAAFIGFIIAVIVTFARIIPVTNLGYVFAVESIAFVAFTLGFFLFGAPTVISSVRSKLLWR